MKKLLIRTYFFRETMIKKKWEDARQKQCQEARKLQMEREKKRLAQNAIENCHPQMLNISCLLCLTSNIHVLYFMRYIGYRVEIAKNINTGLPGYCDKTLIVTVLAIPIPKWHFYTKKFSDIVTFFVGFSVIVTKYQIIPLIP